MKSNLKVLLTVLSICALSFSMAAGQVNKEEQRIKIIIADGTGTKVVIDTLIKNGTMSDSIKLKDGKVIHLSHSENGIYIGKNKGSEHVFVTVSSDSKKTGKNVKEFTIVSSDSAGSTDSGRGNIYVYTGANTHSGINRGQYRVITGSEGGERAKSGIVYINEGNNEDKDTGENFDIYVNKKDKSSEVEKTKYVIKRDGMVISVEGSDYAKVREIVKEIEGKLDKKQESDVKNEAVKADPKISGKKK